MFKTRFISMLVLLAAVATGARADWTGGTYTATANENLGAITVNADATLTINEGVTVTVTGGINVASGTLTVTGPGTLVVTGSNGSNGQSDDVGGNGTPGGVAISGNIIVQDGATVQANGGAGGDGGAGKPDNGGHGANGAAAISGNVTILGGATVKATGGNGGNGGNSVNETGGNGAQGGAAITGEVTIQDASTLEATGGNGGKGGDGDFVGGKGGNGGNAFAGTLTYKSGTVTANGGSGGSGGSGGYSGGSSGSAGNAFANDVDFTQTTVEYTLTDGSNTITTISNQKTVVIAEVVFTGYSVSLKSGTEDDTSWQGKAGEGDYQELPLTGLEAGTAVSVKYGGTKKVKSVKAKKKAAADNPAPTTASIEDYTAGTFGWDGDGSAATGLPTINTFAANDKISILSAKNTNTQFTTSAGGASADFTGSATDDSKFYAVYPYTEGLTLSGDVITGIVIPSDQWNSNWGNGGAYSGWDPKAPIAYATTTGSSLTFHNACAILKVTITGSGTWAIFTISANEPLAGTFSLDTSTGTLTPTSESTTVAVGTDFSYTNCFETQGGNKTAYIAIAPGTYTNFTLYLTNEDGGHNSKTKSGSVTFEAGKIYDLGSYNVEYF